MKLYGNALAPTTQMLLIAAAEKGHGVELVEVDFAKGEQHSDAHRARHPFELTPVWEDENGLIYEARAILRYIDRALAGPSLTPSDARAHGLMEQFISVEQSYFTPNIMAFFYAKFLGRPYTAEQLAAALAAAGKTLDVVEKNLADRPYLSGDTFSLADIAWIPYLRIAQMTGNGQLLAERARVQDWATRICARPSCQAK